MSTQLNYRRTVTHRLQSAGGHVAAVLEMVESDRPAEDILKHLDAVRGALDAVGSALMDHELERIFDGKRLSRRKKERLIELARLRLRATNG